MDFTLSEERTMLADTLNRFIRDKYDLPTRHKAAEMEHGYDPARWAEFAELGAIGALLPEEAGGFGGAGEDLLVVFEALGRGLVVEPFLATGILGASPLIGAGKDDLIEEVIGRKPSPSPIVSPIAAMSFRAFPAALRAARSPGVNPW